MSDELKRRHFLKNSIGAIAGLSAYSFTNIDLLAPANINWERKNVLDPNALAKDEEFWEDIQKMYKPSKEFINLENGYYSMMSEPVRQSQMTHLNHINENHSYFMRRERKIDKEKIYQQVAELAGCSTEELLLCRNTTEALDTIILGLQLNKGDEVILTDVDYPSVVQCFAMRARRYGSVNKTIKIPSDPKSDEEIVEAYEKAITNKTKVLVVTHINNFTGQILPVSKISRMAHKYDVEVISDSAHAFAHVDFKIPELECDYLGTSLHKRLGAPLGTGLLYMKKEKIGKVWPLYGDDTYDENDIRKFSHVGTLPCHDYLAIEDAINFHQKIGGKQKEERLRFLSTYWMDKLRDEKNIQIYSPSDSQRYGAIGNVGVTGIDSAELVEILYEKYGIFTTTKRTGIRVTPHLYNTMAELDTFVAAMKEIAS